MTVEIVVRSMTNPTENPQDENYRIFERSEKWRRAKLKQQLKKYRISLEEYEMLFDAVEGRCQICGKQEDRLCVDHDHETDEIRGLLCRKCNLGLGCFEDKPDLLEKAAGYLKPGTDLAF